MSTQRTTATVPCHRCLGSHPHTCVNLSRQNAANVSDEGSYCKSCKSRQNCQGTEPQKTNKEDPLYRGLTAVKWTVNDKRQKVQPFTIAGSGQDPIIVKLTVNNLTTYPNGIGHRYITVTAKQANIWQDPQPSTTTNRQMFSLRHSYIEEVLQVLGEAKVTVNYGE